MSDRPRRSVRQKTKSTASTSSASPGKSKRVSQVTDPAEALRSLLDSPKSILTEISISDVLNLGAWEMLSEESRNKLSKLLPPTAFIGYTDSLGSSHPASRNCMDVDQKPKPPSAVDPAVIFNNPHFLAAAHTFQDHLFSGWLSAAHQQKVQTFLNGVDTGTLAAPWKDETWLEANAEPQVDPAFNAGAPSTGGITSYPSGLLAGGAAQIKLTTLVKEGILQVGDILAYRRNFTNVDTTVEKDAIIHSIDSKTYALTLLIASGATRDLAENVLQSLPTNFASLPNKLTSITSPTMLETGLLDVDGRVDKSQRPNGNAWKAVTVWRRRPGAETSAGDRRGGRESHGTLFYLRSVYYNEH